MRDELLLLIGPSADEESPQSRGFLMVDGAVTETLDSDSPNVKVAAFLGPQGVLVENLPQQVAAFHADACVVSNRVSDRPALAAGVYGVDSSESECVSDVLQHCAIIIAQPEHKANTVPLFLVGRDVEGGFSVSQASEPMAEGVVDGVGSNVLCGITASASMGTVGATSTNPLSSRKSKGVVTKTTPQEDSRGFAAHSKYVIGNAAATLAAGGGAKSAVLFNGAVAREAMAFEPLDEIWPCATSALPRTPRPKQCVVGFRDVVLAAFGANPMDVSHLTASGKDSSSIDGLSRYGNPGIEYS